MSKGVGKNQGYSGVAGARFSAREYYLREIILANYRKKRHIFDHIRL